MYPLDQRDRDLIDAILDELHDTGRLSWIIISTSFSYSFVFKSTFQRARKVVCLLILKIKADWNNKWQRRGYDSQDGTRKLKSDLVDLDATDIEICR